MAPSLDPAISKALGIDIETATISSHGSSIVSTTLKISAKIDGRDRLFFVKTGQGKKSEVMFAGEHASLNAIHEVVPSFCPKSYAHGALSSNQGFFLATDFLNLNSKASPQRGSGLSFAAKLAKLHNKPAPIPETYDSPRFGFAHPTCCGSTQQPNDFKASWADFYANQRLRAIMNASVERNGSDPELKDMVEKTASTVVPRLLRDGHLGGGKGIVPVVVHGDLWSGNHGRGSIGDGPEEEVVFDSSAVYGHSEYELGIMKMFGGFGGKIMEEYHSLKPKDEPVEEYEDRVALYELYHHLNHHAMFGGGYRAGAMTIMKRLVIKYTS